MSSSPPAKIVCGNKYCLSGADAKLNRHVTLGGERRRVCNSCGLYFQRTGQFKRKVEVPAVGEGGGGKRVKWDGFGIGASEARSTLLRECKDGADAKLVGVSEFLCSVGLTEEERGLLQCVACGCVRQFLTGVASNRDADDIDCPILGSRAHALVCVHRTLCALTAPSPSPCSLVQLPATNHALDWFRATCLGSLGVGVGGNGLCQVYLGRLLQLSSVGAFFSERHSQYLPTDSLMSALSTNTSTSSSSPSSFSSSAAAAAAAAAAAVSSPFSPIQKSMYVSTSTSTDTHAATMVDRGMGPPMLIDTAVGDDNCLIWDATMDIATQTLVGGAEGRSLPLEGQNLHLPLVAPALFGEAEDTVDSPRR
jgi:hypothetical protein